MLKPKAIIFDWDNTLVDTHQLLRDVFQLTLDNFLKDSTPQELIEEYRHHSSRISFPIIFGDNWKAAHDFFYKNVQELHLDYLTPLEGATSLLDHLKTLNIPTAVVSNKWGELLRKEANHLGWSGRFTHLIGSLDVVRDKPAPDPIHHILKELNLEPAHDIWFVGDSPVDWKCALAAGCQGVVIHNDSQPEAEFPSLISVANCGQLQKIL